MSAFSTSCTNTHLTSSDMEKHNTDKEILAILKAARKQSRDAEIAAHGKPISYAGVVRSKKLYTRKEKHKKPFE